MNLPSYLAVIADSDVFGVLAIYCLVVALSGLFKTYRQTRTYRALAFCGLLIIPVLHAAGSYFLNQAPA